MKIPSNNNPTLQPQAAAPKQERIPQLEQAAKMYEQMFLNEMVKAMRQATPKSDLIQENMAQKIYEDKLYDEYVGQWADTGGVGLSNIIYDQMMERFGDMIRRQNVKKPEGPVHPNGKVNVKKIENQTGALLFKMNPSENQKDPLGLTLPWDGKVASSQRIDDSRNVVRLHHNNGLKSTLLFQGLAVSHNPEKDLKAGDRLGIMPPGNSEILWRIEKS